jgi:hypothetical protein
MNVPGASHPDTTDPAFPGQAVSRLREDGLAIFSGFRDRASLAEAARSVTIDATPDDWVTITVTDQGGPWTSPAPDDYRHGLEAVAWLAIDGDSGECAVSFALPQTSCDD